MTTIRAQSIAIVGAGPAGMIAAKYLLAEETFSKIVIFEQRSSTGGIWNYTPEDYNDDLFSVPQLDPRGKNSEPIWRDSPLHDRNIEPRIASFLSPLYAKLETNIPRGLMGFTDLNWPQESQLFPKHSTVLQYIQEYGRDVEYLTQLETQVINVEAADQESNGSWNVTTRDLRSAKVSNHTYDAVVVASGHFIVPFLPNIQGVNEWNKRYPGVITHSKYYRSPDHFEGKKVIVIGNSASGIDISSQIATCSKLPLLWSSKSTSMFNPTSNERKRELPPIARFLLETRGVEFEDGTIENDIDAIVFATGYLYSFPFLHNVEPQLIGDGSHVQHTYKHLFFAPRPTLSFVALPHRVIPFPLSEAQSSLLARVYSGRLSLPSLPDMIRWEEETLKEMGSGRNFHQLASPKDGNYINELSNWALTASRKLGLDNDGQGKVPPVWKEWEFWCREQFPSIRKAFGAKGKDRANIRSLEELGFSYEEHLKKKRKGEAKLI